MEFRIFNTIYDVLDNTECGLNESILSTIAKVARDEIMENYANAWNNFDIAFHAINSGEEKENFLQNFENEIGLHILGVWGIDNRIEETQHIIVAFDHMLCIDCLSYAGDITECDNLIVLDNAPTEEEVNAIYDNYVANYGEILDANKINGVQ